MQLNEMLELKKRSFELEKKLRGIEIYGQDELIYMDVNEKKKELYEIGREAVQAELLERDRRKIIERVNRSMLYLDQANYVKNSNQDIESQISGQLVSDQLKNISTGFGAGIVVGFPAGWVARGYHDKQTAEKRKKFSDELRESTAGEFERFAKNFIKKLLVKREGEDNVENVTK